MKRSIVLLLALAAAPAAAQQGTMQPATNSTASAAVNASRNVWQMMTRYVTAAAEQMPEADYGFKPTDSVRTFGQIIGHVAGAQFMFCAAALGEPARAEDEVEASRTTKAELVQALRESTEYCARAYAQTDAATLGTADLFGQQMPKLMVLNMNAAHNGEHYGNLVTYLRIKGMVPPSSQPQN